MENASAQVIFNSMLNIAIFFLLFYIIVLVAAVAGVWVWWWRKYEIVKQELARTQKELERERELFNGFDEYNRKIAQLKAERKQKIMDLLKERGKVNVNQVCFVLDVSRATASRYFDELEQEGRIRQIGTFGKKVTYKAN